MRPLKIVILFFTFFTAYGGASQWHPDVIKLRPPEACDLFEATCPNKQCIAKNLICDGKNDCSDGSDEINCNHHHCKQKEFRCTNKKCIAKAYRCDSENDCGDNSDEINCTNSTTCGEHEFTCWYEKQCILKIFQCDLYNDCNDGSDEYECSPVRILQTPKPGVQLQVGEIFEINCFASGMPQPEIAWRLNLGPIPGKCRTTSENGRGTLICSDIQEADQGAYSCEGINIKGSVFAEVDTILVVKPKQNLCPNGFLNKETNECVSCFCSNVTKECDSADLFKQSLPLKHHLQSDGSYKFTTVKKDIYRAVFDISDEPIYNLRLTQSYGAGGIHAQVENGVLPYFELPNHYLGNQMKSYGGYINYNIIMNKYERGRLPSLFPDVIIKGNGYTLLYFRNTPQGIDAYVSIRLIEGEWLIQGENEVNKPASREEIMVTLSSVQNILIKLQYGDGFLDTIIDNVEIDSATTDSTGLGRMSFVEQCKCPVEYGGLSCEICATGYYKKGHHCNSNRYFCGSDTLLQ